MATKSPVITAAICTFNRHDLLREAVGALLKQTVDRNLFRVLIVDNSTDREAAESYYKSACFDPIVSVVWSAPPGLSRARNCAAATCKTPYIAYLDDDVRPDPTWLSSLLDGFSHSPKVAAVGGPIVPIWPKRRPRWLPNKHLGVLGCHHPADNDGELPEYQYLYGCNIAFAVENLQAIGGFQEQVGRKGVGSLLSSEETQVQDALRDAGFLVWFSKSASVRHIVHEDRLRRNWLRSRMIWQSASEQLQDPPKFHRDWALDEIRRLAEQNPDVQAAIRLFFKEVEGEDLNCQLDAIRHFSALLMNGHRMEDSALEAHFALSNEQVDDYPSVNDFYAPSAAGTSDAQFLFVEGVPGHQYLYDLFGDLSGAQLLTYPGRLAWDWDATSKTDFRNSLKYVYRSIAGKVKALFFLTFDALIYGGSPDEAFQFLRACPVPTFGILHRMPSQRREIEAAQLLDDLVGGVCFLSETMAEHARSTLGLRNASYLPHHPTSAAFPIALSAREKVRARMGIRPDQVAFSLIGEARQGKGIPLLLAALERIPPAERERMFFLFAGKATHYSNEEIREGLVKSLAMGFSDLRVESDRLKYAVLTQREYAEYVAASDIGLLLYQEEGGQRLCMSGVLGDYIWAGRRVIATAQSYAGAEVRRHHLGLTLEEETPAALAAILVDALRGNPAPLSQGAVKYRQQIAPDAVLNALRRLMDRSSWQAAYQSAAE